MKVELKGKKIELTIETEEELCDLWHRMNLYSSVINKHCTELKYGAETNLGKKFWLTLDKLVKENNLTKDK